VPSIAGFVLACFPLVRVPRVDLDDEALGFEEGVDLVALHVSVHQRAREAVAVQPAEEALLVL